MKAYEPHTIDLGEVGLDWSVGIVHWQGSGRYGTKMSKLHQLESNEYVQCGRQFRTDLSVQVLIWRRCVCNDAYAKLSLSLTFQQLMSQMIWFRMRVAFAYTILCAGVCSASSTHFLHINISVRPFTCRSTQHLCFNNSILVRQPYVISLTSALVASPLHRWAKVAKPRCANATRCRVLASLSAQNRLELTKMYGHRRPFTIIKYSV